MKYVLMNKNTEVLIANYDEGIKVFDKIIEIRNIEYAPLIIKKSYEMKEDFRFNLNDWFIGRGIPSWRDELDMLLARLNISTPLELFDRAFALSLSDQYWIKQVGSNIKYEDVNFFDNDFDSLFQNHFFPSAFHGFYHHKYFQDFWEKKLLNLFLLSLMHQVYLFHFLNYILSELLYNQVFLLGNISYYHQIVFSYDNSDI